MRRQWGAGVLLAVLALSCSSKTIPIQVGIVTQGCDPKVDPFEGVQYLWVRVTGEGLAAPLISKAPRELTAREINIPDIPAGSKRQIEVRGYDKDPDADGRVLSAGKSLPFDVPDVIPAENERAPIVANVILRKVNVFTPTVPVTGPAACSRLRVARAGHTATLMRNGKVFIAGGFNIVNGTVRQALSDTEVYNPGTGAFESSQELSLGTSRIPKAFHTASVAAGGQVMLWGGETYIGSNNKVVPNALVLFYDPDSNHVGAIGPRSPLARTRHRAVSDAKGRVLIVGGEALDGNGNLVPIPAVEWFDPETVTFKTVDGVSMPRREPSVVAVQNGEIIAVAGGSSDAGMQSEVAFFQHDGTTFRQKVLSTPPRLADPGRRAAAAAPINESRDFIMMGGYTDPVQVKPVGSSEIIGTTTATVSQGPAVGARGESCAVQLADGRVLTVGGLSIEALGSPPKTESASVIVTAGSAGGAVAVSGPPLSVPRYLHSCTLLTDGTVLVLGGMREENNVREILQDAYVFQPAPID